MALDMDGFGSICYEWFPQKERGGIGSGQIIKPIETFNTSASSRRTPSLKRSVQLFPQCPGGCLAALVGATVSTKEETSGNFAGISMFTTRLPLVFTTRGQFFCIFQEFYHHVDTSVFNKSLTPHLPLCRHCFINYG